MKLERSSRFPQPTGPVVFVVMDGVGVGPDDDGNAVHMARKPNLDRLRQLGAYTTIRAHGTAVGLPSDDDMGNSEVGHNAIGAGRVYAQGAKLVNQAIESGAMFDGEVWKQALSFCQSGALHFVGLLSDGNVHSHIVHLEKMIEKAADAGAKKVFVHILLDGRDVGETTALEYVDRLETFLARYDGERSFKIASGGGRMKVTMDRYEADWGMVELGWQTHVRGEGERFSSARAAIEALRARTPGIIDQYLPAFVIGDGEEPIGPVRDGDSVLFFNFRGDRAIEISRAFDSETFDKFDRGPKPKVFYAGMMQYDGDEHIPQNYLVSPPSIEKTMGEYLSQSGVKQWACSETQKFGHVTYFWNGNRSGKFSDELETYVEIPSDTLPYEERPWMKAAEITDATISAIQSGEYQFIRLNYANGDMVGHTGIRDAAVLAVEAVDISIGRLMSAVQAAGGVLLVTADHGNADEMFMRDKKGQVKKDETGRPQPKTSHTLQPVPVYLYDPTHGLGLRSDSKAGLTYLTATTLELLGFEPPSDYDPSLLEPKI